jgi:hypothetical protein
MKASLLLLSCTLLSLASFSQTYISLAPSLTNSPGTLGGKSNIALELGQQWDVFSMGIDIGKTTLGHREGRDTSAYLELRPNLNVFQQGKFTNTFTAGIGLIFHAKENLMTELTSGIEYAFSNRFHFNVFFGQYFYSGRYSASDVTFFGISAMFYFSPSLPSSLLKPKKQ